MDSIVNITADLSVVAFALAWWLAVRTRSSAPNSRLCGWSNRVYAAGAMMMAIHIASAYGIAHRWSHQAALDHTAGETLAVVGLSVPQGLYVNFLFLVAYVGDAAWRLRAGHHLSRHPKWLARSIDIFLISIVLMSTIVFEWGLVRWFALAAVLVIALTRSNERKEHADSSS